MGLVFELMTVKSRAMKSWEKTTSLLRGGLEVPLVARYSNGWRHAKYAREIAAMAARFWGSKGIL